MKISAADFWASIKLPIWTIYSNVSFCIYLGKVETIFSIWSLFASPSIGTNLTTVSRLETAAAIFSVLISTLFWYMHLIAYLKLFFSLLDIFLNQDKVLKTDLVLPKWSNTPLSIGYPRALTMSIRGFMLNIWNLNVSLSDGWFKNPLLTQYQTAKSEFSSVVTNWASPHREAIVLVLFNLKIKCSVAFFSISFKYYIYFSLTMYQIAA